MKLIFAAGVLIGLGAIIALLAGVSIRRLFGLAMLAVFFGISAVLAGVIFGSEHWTLSLLGNFLLLTPIAGTGLVICALAVKQFWLALQSAVLLSLSVLMAGPWLMPNSVAAAGGVTFKVMEFNVWTMNGRGDAVYDLIKNSGADIVVLVEMTSTMRVHLQSLRSVYPYRSACTRGWGCDRLILAKTPFTEVGTTDGSGLYSLNSIRIRGCNLTLLATHLAHGFPAEAAAQQLREIQTVANAAAAVRGAKLVVGDFNAAPWSSTIQTLLRTADLAISRGWGGTYPSRLPSFLNIPIDHIMAGRGLAITSRRVLPYAGSDHYGVLSDVEITDPSICH